MRGKRVCGRKRNFYLFLESIKTLERLGVYQSIPKCGKASYTGSSGLLERSGRRKGTATDGEKVFWSVIAFQRLVDAEKKEKRWMERRRRTDTPTHLCDHHAYDPPLLPSVVFVFFLLPVVVRG